MYVCIGAFAGVFVCVYACGEYLSLFQKTVATCDMFVQLSNDYNVSGN